MSHQSGRRVLFAASPGNDPSGLGARLMERLAAERGLTRVRK